MITPDIDACGLSHVKQRFTCDEHVQAHAAEGGAGGFWVYNVRIHCYSQLLDCKMNIFGLCSL